MAKHYTVGEAARIARCSPATIHYGIKQGYVRSELNGRIRRVTMPRDEIAAVIKEHHPRARPHNAPKPEPEVGEGAIQALVAWARLEPAKREALTKLAEKYSADELALLLTL